MATSLGALLLVTTPARERDGSTTNRLALGAERARDSMEQALVRASTRRIASVKLSPSPERQRVEVDEALSIEMPEGLLSRPKRLDVSRGRARVSLGGEDLGARPFYDISLGERGSFEPPLTLELRLDGAGEGGPEDLVSVAVFDDEVGEWVLVESDLDLEAGVARVHTEHLSRWTVLTVPRLAFSGTDVASARPRFTVSGWDPESEKYVLDRQSSHLPPPRVFNVVYRRRDRASVGGRPVPIDELASQLAEALDAAFWAYFSRGYRVPFPGRGRSFVALMEPKLDRGAGQYGDLANFIYLPTRFSNEGEVRLTAAHEVFHLVQRSELRSVHGRLGATRAMRRDIWMMEATAEYAAHVVAQEPKQQPGSEYRLYIDQSMDAVNDQSEYADAHFLRYLIEAEHFCPASAAGGRACFLDMWRAMAAGQRAREGLLSFLREHGAPEAAPLFHHYARFLHWMLMSEERPENVLFEQPPTPTRGTARAGPTNPWGEREGLPTWTGRLDVPKPESMRAKMLLPPDLGEATAIELELEGGPSDQAVVAVFVIPVRDNGWPVLTPGMPLPTELFVAGARSERIFDLEPGHGILFTIHGLKAGGGATLRATILPGDLRLDIADMRARRRMVVAHHPALDEEVVREVKLHRPYVMRASLGRLSTEVERVEVEWSLPPHFENAAGTHTGPFRIDTEGGEQPAHVDVAGIFRGVGENRVEAAVFDVSGLRRTELQRARLTFHTAAIASAEESPRRVGERGFPVVVTAHEARGGPYSYRWSFGDGKVEETSTGVARHVYEEAGSYQVTLELLLPRRLPDELRVLARSDPRRVRVGEREAPAAAKSSDAGGSVHECIRRCPPGYAGVRCRAMCEGASGAPPPTSRGGGEQKSPGPISLPDCPERRRVIMGGD